MHDCPWVPPQVTEKKQEQLVLVGRAKQGLRAGEREASVNSVTFAERFVLSKTQTQRAWHICYFM